jgi:hypothetical protein
MQLFVAQMQLHKRLISESQVVRRTQVSTKKNPTSTGRTDGATKLINEKVFSANLITVLIKKQENHHFFCNFLLKTFVRSKLSCPNLFLD